MQPTDSIMQKVGFLKAQFDEQAARESTSLTAQLYGLASGPARLLTDQALPKLFSNASEQVQAAFKGAFALFPATATALAFHYGKRYDDATFGLLTAYTCEMGDDPKRAPLQRPAAIGLLALNVLSIATDLYERDVLGAVYDLANAARLGLLLIEKKNA